MPLYEYLCRSCEHRFERIRKFSDPPLTECPKCGGEVEKLLSSPAIQFKGSGFYITDYPKSGSGGAAGKDGSSSSSSESSGSSGSSSESSSDSKKGDKSESKSDKSEKKADKASDTKPAAAAAGSKPKADKS